MIESRVRYIYEDEWSGDGYQSENDDNWKRLIEWTAGQYGQASYSSPTRPGHLPIDRHKLIEFMFDNFDGPNQFKSCMQDSLSGRHLANKLHTKLGPSFGYKLYAYAFMYEIYFRIMNQYARFKELIDSITNRRHGNPTRNRLR